MRTRAPKHKNRDEIDNIFDKKKVEPSRTIKKEVATKSNNKRVPAGEMKSKKRKIPDDSHEWVGKGEKKKARYTEDGLKIYTLNELGINSKSGGTPLCPFDCDCCH